MHVVVYDPFLSNDQAGVLGVKLLTLKELLKQSDYITIHTPLNDETFHLIGTEIGRAHV